MSYEFPKDKPVVPGQDIPEKEPSPGQDDNNQDNPVPDYPTGGGPAKKLEQFEK